MRRNDNGMAKQEMSFRPELRAADDAVIEDAIARADPMVLRGLLYQLTADPEVAATGVKTVLAGYFDVAAPATEADVALLRRKGAAFLRTYRDSGAGPISVGPNERLATSMRLGSGEAMPDETELGLFVEELGLDPGPDLQRMHQQILSAEACLEAPASPPWLAVPRQLPPAPRDPTARSARLAARAPPPTPSGCRTPSR